MPIQGCGVSRNRRRFGGVEFLSTLGVIVGYFVRLRHRSPIGSLLHHTPKLGILVKSVQFLVKLLLKEGVVAVCHDLH